MRYDGWFRLATHLHKDVTELLGLQQPMSYRLFRAWMAWLRMDMNRPSKDNFYSMQIASEVRRTIVSPSDRNSVNTNQFRIPFEFKVPLTPEEEERLAEERAKAIEIATLAKFGVRLGPDGQPAHGKLPPD